MQTRRTTMAKPEEEEDIFQEGDYIDERYEVIKRLGKGGYGEIYSAKDLTNTTYIAVKVERVSKPGNLLEEEKILRALNGESSFVSDRAKYVPKILNSGRHNDMVSYMVLELLGENLSVLRRKQQNHRFSLLTTMALGMQMLRAIKEVHDLGYLHRDIKPGNFVIGSKVTNTHRTVILIDFGLSRRHFRPDGEVRPKRKTARWVGSRRYMSINTHQRKDQGRRDDLWSFLYVLIEFFTGTLPWAHLRGIQNLDNVRDMKIQYNNEKLVRNLPDEFLKFMNHIKELRYEDRPDYEYLHGLMQGLFNKHGGDTQTFLFDWEKDEVNDDLTEPLRPHPPLRVTSSPDRFTSQDSDSGKRRRTRDGNYRIRDDSFEDSSSRRRKGKKRKRRKKGKRRIKCIIM